MQSAALGGELSTAWLPLQPGLGHSLCRAWGSWQEEVTGEGRDQQAAEGASVFWPAGQQSVFSPSCFLCPPSTPVLCPPRHEAGVWGHRAARQGAGVLRWCSVSLATADAGRQGQLMGIWQHVPEQPGRARHQEALPQSWKNQGWLTASRGSVWTRRWARLGGVPRAGTGWPVPGEGGAVGAVVLVWCLVVQESPEPLYRGCCAPPMLGL